MGSGGARTAALLLVAAVLAAACGSSGDEGSADDSATTTTTVAMPVTDEAGASLPGPGQPPLGAAPTADARGPGGVAADPVPGQTGEPAPPAEAQDVGRVGPVGSLGPRYLRPAASERVLIQLLVQDGAAPRPAVPERLRQVLSSLSGKTVTIATTAVSGGARSWTADDLRALADGSSPPQTPDQAVLTLAYLRGGFAESERAIGVAVRGDVAAVFAERVTEAAGVFGDRDAVEDAVSLHEVGHLLGLVDLVVDTGRADPEHPGHSPSRGSVMYYAVESTLLGSILTGGPPRDFDRDDLDELTRIRNG